MHYEENLNWKIVRENIAELFSNTNTLMKYLVILAY